MLLSRSFVKRIANSIVLQLEGLLAEETLRFSAEQMRHKFEIWTIFGGPHTAPSVLLDDFKALFTCLPMD